MKTNCRSNTSGTGLVILIILLALIGAGAWWLFNNKKTMDREARAFAREFVQRVAVNHDPAFFAEHLSPQTKLEFPPSRQQSVMGKLQEMGVAAWTMQCDPKARGDRDNKDKMIRSYFPEPALVNRK